MGTIKRLKDEQEKLKNAENAVPGAYESQYTGRVNDRLSQMGAQNEAGFDFDTTNEAYQQYRARVAQNAQNAATAATDTAQKMAGGYGGDWAASAANQAAAGQTAAAGTSLADLRSQALQEWQNQLSGENNLVDTLLGQDAQERATAGMTTSAAQNWRDYLASQVSQARQENSDFWSNVWNGVLSVGNAIKTGYDGYMGYTYQKEQLELQKKAVETQDYNIAWNLYDQGREQEARQYLKNRGLDDSMVDSWKESYATQHSNTDWNYGQAEKSMEYQQAGYGTLAQQAATSGGFDPGILSDWQGIDTPTQQRMTAIQGSAELAGSGNDAAADSYAKLAGLDTGSVDHYSTVAGRQNDSAMDLYQRQQAAALNYNTKLLGVKSQYSTSGKSSSGKSGSSGKSSSGKSVTYTGSELNKMAKDYQTMSPSDNRYSYYGKVLADNGVIPRLTGTGNPGKVNGTAFEQGMYQARQMANSGSSKDEIANYLAGTNLSNALVATIMNQIEAEWR